MWRATSPEPTGSGSCSASTRRKSVGASPLLAFRGSLGALVCEAIHGIERWRKRGSDHSAEGDLVGDGDTGRREQHRLDARVTAQLKGGNTKLDKTISESLPLRPISLVPTFGFGGLLDERRGQEDELAAVLAQAGTTYRSSSPLF